MRPWLPLLLVLSLPSFALTPIADPVLRPAVREQAQPAVAPDGHGGYRLAWTDGRGLDYASRAMPRPPNWDVYGTTVDANGNPAPEAPIAPTIFQDFAPAVVWNGSENVVISQIAGGYTNSGAFAGGLMFTRDGAGGVPYYYDQPPGDVLYDVGGYGNTISLARQTAAAWNGSEYLVAWSRIYTSDGSYAALFDRDFHRIAGPFPIGSNASVASDGDGFLVTWLTDINENDHQIRVATISAAGTLNEIATPLETWTDWRYPSLSRPSVAWNGRDYLVVWADQAIYGRFIHPDGTLGDAITVASVDGVTAHAPSIAWNGSEFLVTFAYRNEFGSQFPPTNLYATRLRGDGSLIDQPYPLTITTAPGEQTLNAVASNGDSFLIAWSDVVTQDVHSALVTSDGRVLNERIPPQSLGDQTPADVVWDGSTLAFAWIENGDVFFGRATPDGHLLDGSGIDLRHAIAARLLLTNSDYVIVAYADGGTHAMLIARGGDAAIRKVDVTNTYFLDAATDGNDVVIVWTDFAGHSRLRSAVLHGDTVTINPDAIVPPKFDQFGATLVWTGSHYLLNYIEYLSEFTHPLPPSELRQVLLDRGGLAISTPQKAPYRWSSTAAGGGRVLVVTQAVNGPITGQLFDTEGAAITQQFAIGSCASCSLDPEWSGSDFVVFFGSSAVRVSTSGVVTPMNDFALPFVDTNVMAFRVRFLSPNSIAVTYNRRINVVPGIHEGAILRDDFVMVPFARTRAIRR